MKYSFLLLVFCFSMLFLSFRPSERKDFVVEITFVDFLRQPFVKYSLDKNYITVSTSYYDDFKIIKDVLYKRKINALASDSIYNYLNSLKIDTAKANCNNLVLDGLFVTYYYGGFAIEETSFKTHSCFTTSAITLIKLAEGQIKRKRFKFKF
jgi:hypothetical protein